VFGALAGVSAVAGIRVLHREPVLTAPNVGHLPRPSTTVPASHSGTPTAPPPPRGAAEPPAEPTATVHQPRAPAGPPLRLAIPSSGVTAPVVPIGVRPDGSLALPDSPHTVGWWIGSAEAGDRRDGTLLAGHVDSAAQGLGALAALRDLTAGARIQVTDAFGVRHGYAVVARRTYPKYALPDQVFQVTGRPGLTLVTCGGPFDRRAGQYRDNIVVYAAPAG
jgi:hypothetical protein